MKHASGVALFVVMLSVIMALATLPLIGGLCQLVSRLPIR